VCVTYEVHHDAHVAAPCPVQPHHPLICPAEEYFALARRDSVVTLMLGTQGAPDNSRPVGSKSAVDQDTALSL